MQGSDYQDFIIQINGSGPQQDENSCIITLNPMGGSVYPESVSAKRYSTYGYLPTPTREGYDFDGWYTEPWGGYYINSTYKLYWNHDHTLFAHWTQNAKTYTIDYYANGGGGAPASQTKTEGVSMNLSYTEPTRSSSSAGSYKVTLNANGGSVSTSYLTASRTTSYSFKNWNTRSDGSGISYSPGEYYSTNADLTLYAQWYSTTTTGTVTLPRPTRSGYTFKGWATNSSATSGVTGSYKPSGNVTLFAVWQEGESNGISISDTSFPSASFRSIVQQFDTDNDGYLSSVEIAAVTEIDCSYNNISSLKGIEYFTALTTLNCPSNQLKTLDVSKNTALTNLYCYNNQLTSLDVSGCAALKSLSCYSNQLTSLDVSGCAALTGMSCRDNNLTSLDVSGCIALVNLWCYRNQLTSLDVSGCAALTMLDCSGNQLTSLDISAFPKLLTALNSGSVTTENGFIKYATSSNNYLKCDQSVTIIQNTTNYSVRYDANGGTKAPESQSKPHGAALTLSTAIPARDAYFFLGWAESQDSTTAAYQPGGSFTKDEDTTLYAVWVKPDFILPSALITIEDEAFAGGAFTYVKLSENTASIGKNAFANCPNLKYIYIPGTNIDIDPDAFGTMTALTIFGKADSDAATYAQQKGFTFIAVS